MPKFVFSELDYETGLACIDLGDYESASGFFRKAAKCGHAGAQFYLGMMCLNGLGLARNREDGLLWLRKAADQDHDEAKQELCILKEGNKAFTEESESLPGDDLLPEDPLPKDPLEKLYREGLKAEDQGYSRRAIALWKKILEQDIRHLDALDALARVYTLAGKQKLAKIYSNMVWKVIGLYL